MKVETSSNVGAPIQVTKPFPSAARSNSTLSNQNAVNQMYRHSMDTTARKSPFDMMKGGMN